MHFGPHILDYSDRLRKTNDLCNCTNEKCKYSNSWTKRKIPMTPPDVFGSTFFFFSAHFSLTNSLRRCREAFFVLHAWPYLCIWIRFPFQIRFFHFSAWQTWPLSPSIPIFLVAFPNQLQIYICSNASIKHLCWPMFLGRFHFSLRPNKNANLIKWNMLSGMLWSHMAFLACKP